MALIKEYLVLVLPLGEYHIYYLITTQNVMHFFWVIIIIIDAWAKWIAFISILTQSDSRTTFQYGKLLPKIGSGPDNVYILYWDFSYQITSWFWWNSKKKCTHMHLQAISWFITHPISKTTCRISASSVLQWWWLLCWWIASTIL